MIVTILICAVGMATAECQSDTATRVLPGPEVGSVFECQMAGSIYAASQPIVSELLNQGNYMKIQCTETNIGTESTG